jgi:hypothetical protein
VGLGAEGAADAGEVGGAGAGGSWADPRAGATARIRMRTVRLMFDCLPFSIGWGVETIPVSGPRDADESPGGLDSKEA